MKLNRRGAYVTFLVILLLTGCGQVPTPWQASETAPPTEDAYPPPPPWSPQPTLPPLPTITPPPLPDATPTPIPVMVTPKPTVPIQPFPTPDVPPVLEGDPPTELGAIWYPYLEAPDSEPMLQAVLVDNDGRYWGELGQSINLGLGPGRYASLYSLHMSKDGRSFVAIVAYGEESRSLWIDPESGRVEPISPDPDHEDFYAWGPDRQIFAGNSVYMVPDIWLLDLITRDYRVFDFPVSEYGYSRVGAIATSPDGLIVADASLYRRTSPDENDRVEIGLQPLSGGGREILTVFQDFRDVDIQQLDWSPDGKSLTLSLFVRGIGPEGSHDSQLWLVDVDSGSTTFLTHNLLLTAWSPDAQHIAFTREETGPEGLPSNNLWLFESTSFNEVPLTDYADQYISSIAWSPSGQELAFVVTFGDYGEVWITSLDGTEQYPVAGPTTPYAPIIWQPVVKGD